MRHAILGPGGVGGLIGACLAHSGNEVTMVVRPEAAATYPGELDLQSPFGNLTVPVAHSATVPACDVLWITPKATQLEGALSAIKDASQIGAMVPLLNGVDHVAMLRSRYGHDRVVPATIAVETERVAPGRIVHRSAFARLNVASMGRARVGEAVDQLQKMGFTTQWIDDEATLLWSKMVFLAPLALSSSASGMTTGEMASSPEWKNKLLACVGEVASVAKAEGAKVNPETVISIIASLPGGMRSSMQKDVAAGREPELDAIAGAILRGADRHHVPAPVTRGLAEAVRAKVGH